MMNERIADLLEQAFDRCKKYDDEGQTGLVKTTEAFYVFAELIVTECCQKLENDGMVEVAMELKEHFGVEVTQGWICPKCGVDRTKQVCPSGYNSLLVGQCPMIGVAQ